MTIAQIAPRYADYINRYWAIDIAQYPNLSQSTKCAIAVGFMRTVNNDENFVISEARLKAARRDLQRKEKLWNSQKHGN